MSSRPKSYRCPFCGQQFLAMTDHVLVAPEGDTRRRRHAHTPCTVRARAGGQLPTRDEAFPRPPGRLHRLLARWRG